jgi:hypothetical protein
VAGIVDGGWLGLVGLWNLKFCSTGLNSYFSDAPLNHRRPHTKASPKNKSLRRKLLFQFSGKLKELAANVITHTKLPIVSSNPFFASVDCER